VAPEFMTWPPPAHRRQAISAALARL